MKGAKTMNKKLRFHRDGYDYVAKTKETEYCVSKAYGVWFVWVNDIKQDECFDYIADAKEWCQNHSASTGGNL